MVLRYEDAPKVKPSTPASPKTYTIIRAFTPYDIIQAHAKLFNGADCEEWKRDIQDILIAIGIKHQISDDHLSHFDCLDFTKRTQLRDMLVRAGFVKEKEPEPSIIDAYLKRDESNSWTLSVKLSDSSTWAIVKLGKHGLRRYRGVTSLASLPLDPGGRVQLNEEP